MNRLIRQHSKKILETFNEEIQQQPFIQLDKVQRNYLKPKKSCKEIRVKSVFRS